MYNEGIDYTAGGEKMTVSKVAIASDHGGIELRKVLFLILKVLVLVMRNLAPNTRISGLPGTRYYR